MDEKPLNNSKIFDRDYLKENNTRNIFWGEVVSTTDDTNGGIIRVKIPKIDNKKNNQVIPECYPLLPKFFHVYPKIGEVVRVLIEDIKYPNRSRFWMGPIISQLQKIEYDNIFTALSTTNMGTSIPEKNIKTFPDAQGVFPEKEDVALLGRNNTDVILRENDLEIRSGKHEKNDVFTLNKKNPASIRLVFEEKNENKEQISSIITQADKICLIAHDGIPKFKSHTLNKKDRQNIFKNAHPIARGDILIEALSVIRNAILNHIHPYNTIQADKNDIITDLENINLENILQKNILIN